MEVVVVVLGDAGGGEATSRYLPSTERRCGTYRESESQLASNVASANDKPEMDPLPELLSAGASAAVSTVRWLFVWHLIAGLSGAAGPVPEYSSCSYLQPEVM